MAEYRDAPFTPQFEPFKRVVTQIGLNALTPLYRYATVEIHLALRAKIIRSANCFRIGRRNVF